MSFHHIPDEGVVAILSAWEAQILHAALSDWITSRQQDSPTAAALLHQMRATLEAVSTPPCLCGDVHPTKDCEALRGSPEGD